MNTLQATPRKCSNPLSMLISSVDGGGYRLTVCDKEETLLERDTATFLQARILVHTVKKANPGIAFSNHEERLSRGSGRHAHDLLDFIAAYYKEESWTGKPYDVVKELVDKLIAQFIASGRLNIYGVQSRTGTTETYQCPYAQQALMANIPVQDYDTDCIRLALAYSATLNVTSLRECDALTKEWMNQCCTLAEEAVDSGYLYFIKDQTRRMLLF